MRRWLAAGVLFVLCPVDAAAQSVVRLARIEGIPDQVVGGEILRSIYGRLGMGVELIDVPAARALMLSSTGELDGEIHRVSGIDQQFPTLLQLNPAINYIEPSVFTSGPSFVVGGWGSIAGYSVGIVRGVGSSEAGTSGMPNVHRANDLPSLMRMLEAGRLEIAVTDWFSGEVLSRRLGFNDRIRALRPPLQRIDIYHYLHQRHRELAGRVAAVIAAMAASGELAGLRAELIRAQLDEAAERR